MTGFGGEFINVGTFANGATFRELVLANRDLSDQAARDNTDHINHAALKLIQEHGGGYLVFTPGRYYLGSKSPTVFPITESEADVLIPDKVTLIFMPGATLVPMTIPPSNGAFYRRTVWTDPGQPYKVRGVQFLLRGAALET